MLDYIALGILIFASVTVFYGIIVIHDIPYEISVHRNHPHQDAIHYAGWISLWIWATLYREDRGWGFIKGSDGVMHGQTLHEHLATLEARLEQLEQSVGLTKPENSVPESSVPENKGSEQAEGETG